MSLSKNEDESTLLILENENPNSPKKEKKRTKEKPPTPTLTIQWQPESHFEIGLDEAGRGPLFGRLFVGGVVLPDVNSGFEFNRMKDSKKFSSRKKREEVACYIRENALAWHVAFVEPEEIDRINILQAVYKGMHECVHSIMDQLASQGKFRSVLNSGLEKIAGEGEPECSKTGWEEESGVWVLVDGDRFVPVSRFNETTERYEILNHLCIEGGDNRSCSIAAASILAKTAHDEYVTEMCRKWPELDNRYQLLKGMGYATRIHLNGIRSYGITQWHRKTFGETCKNASFQPLEEDWKSSSS